MHYTQILPETIIGERFKILAKLGQGANSCVYKALDFKNGTFVSIKLLDPFLIHDPISLERFERECQILRSLNHPQVIKVFDVNYTDSEKFMILEYFSGKDLKVFAKEAGPLQVSRILAIIRSILLALSDCHRHGVVHRDLKPQNILINENDQIKIVDFGVSKVSGMSDLTKTGTMIGTPEYMAPEMFLKATLDFRTDIYSLGCILYELLNGGAPFISTQLSQLLSQKMNPDGIFALAKRDDIPEWLHKIALKCLRVDPILRYQNCDELLFDLDLGEKALACMEVKKEKTQCMKCKAEMLPGFSFCYQCGVFQSSLFSQGHSSLVVHQCEDIDRLSSFLGSLFKDVGSARFKRELTKLPFFLLKGVEADTAQNLANEIVYFRTQVQVAKTLEKEFKLPILFVILALLVGTMIALIPSLSAFQKLSALIIFEIGCFALFKIYTRPLLNKKSFLKRESEVSPLIRKFVKDLSALKSNSTKAILGKLAFAALNAKAPPEQLVEALKIGSDIDQYESHLSNQSLISIKTEIIRLEAKVKNSQDLSDVENLAKAKGALKTYYEVQDQCATAKLNLLKFLTPVLKDQARQISKSTISQEKVA